MDPRELVERLARQEEALRWTCFVAPCVAGGKVRARVEGLVHDFEPRPRDFEGWGLFRSIDSTIAEVVEPAEPRHVDGYLRLLAPFRLLLASGLKGVVPHLSPSGGTWLAYPVNESDARQRLGEARPVAVHLVVDGDPFEQVKVRFDGAAFWFEGPDRGGDPRTAERLRRALGEMTPPEDLDTDRLTPEARVVYRMLRDAESARRERRRLRRQRRRDQSDEGRLRRALDLGGGGLQQFRDRGQYWQVEWITGDGEHHTSAISKNDLTVLGAGICLDGQDRDFDLQSLVGVVENAESWAY